MVVDTSIFIDYLRSKDKKKTQLYQIPSDLKIYISAVTYYELIMGATTTEKEEDIEKLTSGLPILSFDEEIAEEAGRIYHNLRKANKMIEFRDIFIAATCIVNDLPVMTKNRKHFERIDGLRIQGEF